MEYNIKIEITCAAILFFIFRLTFIIFHDSIAFGVYYVYISHHEHIRTMYSSPSTEALGI